MVNRGRRVAIVAALIAITAVAQIGIHGRLYGRLSLFGNAPAFVTARLLGDGPARLYLEGHCATSPWLICRYTGHLPASEAEFLWVPGNIWHSLNWDQQDEVRREQWPLARATLQTYPRQQIDISWHNFLRALVTLGPNDFWNSPVFTTESLDSVVPGLGARYATTRQSRNAMPQNFFRNLQYLAVGFALGFTCMLVPRLWNSCNNRLLALAAGTFFFLLTNAFIGGVISGSDPRYQDRMIWLLPMLAILLLADRSFRTQTSAASS